MWLLLLEVIYKTSFKVQFSRFFVRFPYKDIKYYTCILAAPYLSFCLDKVQKSSIMFYGRPQVLNEVCWSP